MLKYIVLIILLTSPALATNIINGDLVYQSSGEKSLDFIIPGIAMAFLAAIYTYGFHNKINHRNDGVSRSPRKKGNGDYRRKTWKK